MRENETHAESQEETKRRIRERYKGISKDELEFIPATPRESLFEDTAYSVCILPPARYFSATLPNKTRHRAGAVCHCIAGAKALPEVCVLAKPLRQRCNWSINLHRRNWQPM